MTAAVTAMAVKRELRAAHAQRARMEVATRAHGATTLQSEQQQLTSMKLGACFCMLPSAHRRQPMACAVAPEHQMRLPVKQPSQMWSESPAQGRFSKFVIASRAHSCTLLLSSYFLIAAARAAAAFAERAGFLRGASWHNPLSRPQAFSISCCRQKNSLLFRQ